MTTLNEILKEHPEWGDLPVGFCNTNGDIHFIEEGNTFFFESEYWDDRGDDKGTSHLYDENGEWTGPKIKVLLITDD